MKSGGNERKRQHLREIRWISKANGGGESAECTLLGAEWNGVERFRWASLFWMPATSTQARKMPNCIRLRHSSRRAPIPIPISQQQEKNPSSKKSGRRRVAGSATEETAQPRSESSASLFLGKSAWGRRKHTDTWGKFPQSRSPKYH